MVPDRTRWWKIPEADGPGTGREGRTLGSGSLIPVGKVCKVAVVVTLVTCWMELDGEGVSSEGKVQRGTEWVEVRLRFGCVVS